MSQVRRRQFLIAAAALFAGSLARAQKPDRPARVAILDGGHEGSSPEMWRAFHRRLSELGYIEGKNIIFERRWGKAETSRLPALAAELVALKPAVIVTVQTSPALAAKLATSTIPIVAIEIADPIRAGLATSLSRPDGNITGFPTFSFELTGKWLEMLREISPKIKSVAFLTDIENLGAMLIFREMQERAQTLGITVRSLDGRNRANVERAFETMARERMEAFVVSGTTVVLAQKQFVIESAARQRILGIYARSEYPEAGGLLSYGVEQVALFPRGAEYVHRILQGVSPSELPFERPAKFKLVVNLRTAKALGLKVPPSILLRADRVIE